MFKAIVICSMVVFANAGLLPQHGVESYEVHSPAQYDFSYSVHDAHTGDVKQQSESRRGDAVQGSYSLIEPDGNKRVVHYADDGHSGFNAVVEREGTVHHQPQQVAVAHAAPIAVAHSAPIAVAHSAPIAVAHSAPIAVAHSPALALSHGHISHQSYSSPVVAHQAVASPIVQAVHVQQPALAIQQQHVGQQLIAGLGYAGQGYATQGYAGQGYAAQGYAGQGYSTISQVTHHGNGGYHH
ncbi:cuticle protein 19.8-like [Contarinia nasturtii]|uniref:cuticle protein 19.8-like n=1 Tax=Contarinia nasturtii TaxID=265458 RepID=UPI0012D45FC8|nr:cuticle protein 19.8-like [Contarinia nasturtii]